MSQDSFVMMVALIAVLGIVVWRQLLKLVATLAVVAFCIGMYHLAQIIHL